MSGKHVKIGRLKVKIPGNAVVLESLDLDNIGLNNIRRPDVYLRLEISGKRISILIEDTGRPRREDIERLYNDEFIYSAGLREELSRDIIVRILHHRGLGKGKTMITKMAQKMRVELKECEKNIDLESLLRKRGLA